MVCWCWRSCPTAQLNKAGLKQHDILLRAGDKNIHSLEDLLAAIAKSKGETISLQILRKGKERTLEIKPAKRPDSEIVALDRVLEADDIELNLTQGDQKEMKFMLVGPGARVMGPNMKLHVGKWALDGEHRFKVTIEKKDDKPAVIRVEHDGEAKEFTADDLSRLPEAVRGHVKSTLKNLKENASIEMVVESALEKAPGKVIQEDVHDHVIRWTVNPKEGLAGMAAKLEDLVKRWRSWSNA